MLVSRDSDIIQWADSGSKDFQSDDYSLDPATFKPLESTFGKFDTDAFATTPNVVCEKFYSRYSSSGSSGGNFFAQGLSSREFF